VIRIGPSGEASIVNDNNPNNCARRRAHPGTPETARQPAPARSAPADRCGHRRIGADGALAPAAGDHPATHEPSQALIAPPSPEPLAEPLQSDHPAGPAPPQVVNNEKRSRPRRPNRLRHCPRPAPKLTPSRRRLQTRPTWCRSAYSCRPPMRRRCSNNWSRPAFRAHRNTRATRSVPRPARGGDGSGKGEKTRVDAVLVAPH